MLPLATTFVFILLIKWLTMSLKRIYFLLTLWCYFCCSLRSFGNNVRIKAWTTFYLTSTLSISRADRSFEFCALCTFVVVVLISIESWYCCWLYCWRGGSIVKWLLLLFLPPPQSLDGEKRIDLTFPSQSCSPKGYLFECRWIYSSRKAATEN